MAASGRSRVIVDESPLQHNDDSRRRYLAIAGSTRTFSCRHGGRRSAVQETLAAPVEMRGEHFVSTALHSLALPCVHVIVVKCGEVRETAVTNFYCQSKSIILYSDITAF